MIGPLSDDDSMWGDQLNTAGGESIVRSGKVHVSTLPLFENKCHRTFPIGHLKVKALGEVRNVLCNGV